MRFRLLLAVVFSALTGSVEEARADSRFVLYSGAGPGAGVSILDPGWRFTARVTSGAGILSDGNTGGGVLLEAALFSEFGGGLSFDEGLRAEGSLRLLSSKGALRLSLGGGLKAGGIHGAIAYGIPIRAHAKVLATPELMLLLARRSDGDFVLLAAFQFTADWLWGQW